MDAWRIEVVNLIFMNVFALALEFPWCCFGSSIRLNELNNSINGTTKKNRSSVRIVQP